MIRDFIINQLGWCRHEKRRRVFDAPRRQLTIDLDNDGFGSASAWAQVQLRPLRRRIQTAQAVSAILR